MMKAALFDFGGTIDTNGIHWSEKFWDIYKKNNVNITKTDYEKAYIFAENNMGGQIKPGFGMKATLGKQIELQVLYLKNMQILKDCNYEVLTEGLTESCYNDVTVTVKEVKQYLGELKKNIVLGVISNFYGNLDSVLEEFSIKNYFSSVFDSEVIGLKKPDPQMFTYAVNEMDIQPEETWMIGDSYDRDILPAKTAGLKTIWLKGRSWKNEENTGYADFTITSLSELYKIIN